MKNRIDPLYLGVAVAFVATVIVLGVIWKFNDTNEQAKTNSQDRATLQSKVFQTVPTEARSPASLGSPGTGDQRVDVTPVDAPGLVSRGMSGADPYAKYPVMSFEESPQDQAGHFERVRVVKTESKYPYLRVVEKWGSARDGDQLMDRKVMVADHVLLKLAEGATEAQLAALVKTKGGYIERKVSEQGRLYSIGFQAYDVSALDQMIAELSASTLVIQPEPDYVVRR